MIKNMGVIDRTIRVLLATAMVVLFAVGVLKGMAAVLLLALAAIFLITSLAGFCPLYLPFRFSTKGKERQEAIAAKPAESV